MRNILMKTLACMILVMMFVGCRGKNENVGEQTDGDSIQTDSVEYVEGEVVHLDMTYYDFDKVKNLSLFFDSIAKKHEIPLRDIGDDNEPVDRVKKCISAIERYRKGHAKFYPDSMVKSCLSMMGHDAANIDNHNPGVDLVYDEWLLMCMAYYAPDITYLVDMQTPDHNAGIRNFGKEYNYNPWWAYLFLKREKGYEVRCMGNNAKFSSIFQLEDAEHRKYYLCSNNSMLGFRQELFWVRGEGDVVNVISCRDIPHDEDVNFDCYYFDKNRLQWFYSKWNENYERMISVSDVPLLTLKLNGVQSLFERQ